MDSARWYAWAICAIATVGHVLPARSHAQSLPELAGLVVDATSRMPVADARVSVRPVAETGWGIQVSTLADGAFRRALPAGQYSIEVERAGYTEWHDTVRLREGETTRVVIELHPAPLVLPSVQAEVVRRSTDPRLSGFWARRDQGNGIYFTREDIERRQPHQVADLFNGLPGARVTTAAGPGGGSALMFGRAGCPADVYIDGVHFGTTVRGVNELNPAEVEAIEVYTAARVPAQFNRVRAAGRGLGCGAVVIWTRSGR